MGLDVYAYTKLVKNDADHGVKFYDNPDFPGRGEGVDFDAEYEDEYEEHYCSGYGRYNIWRDELARVAGYPAVEDVDGSPHSRYARGAWVALEGPFWELINFADNEGTIGPVVSAKLAADFETYAHLRDALDEQYHGWWDFFAKAFKLAADDGAVMFS